MAKLRLRGISRPSAIIAAHRENQKRSQSIQKRKRSASRSRSRSRSPIRSPKRLHVERAKTMRVHKPKNLAVVPRREISLHNNVKDRLSLKRGLLLAEELKLKRADASLQANTIVRVIAPTQPRGPLSRVNGMVGKVVGFKEKGENTMAIVNINVDNRTSNHIIPYNYIRIL